MPKQKANIFVQADLDMKTYVRRILAPSIVASVVLFVVLSLLTTFISTSSMIRIALYAISLLPLIYAFMHPYSVASGKRVKINSKIPYFVTYFAVLSTSEVGRDELILNLAKEKVLEPISRDMEKIYYLIAKFNRGMPEAFRFLAKRTPSKVFSDFLERLAYSLDSGVELKDYLLQEQKIVMDDYQTFYEGALYDLDVFKEVYSSLIISVVFMVTFIIIGPIITGQDLVTLTIFTFILVMVVEIGVLILIKHKMPEDSIWASNAMNAERRAKVTKGALISITGTVVVALLYLFVLRVRFNIPMEIALALIMSPLAYIGYVLTKEEENILIKDENFPAFMRSLSSSLAASGASMALVLKYLSSHDFGTLTKDIKNLNKRISLKIDDTKSWKYFVSDTGSWLIDIFSDIFRKSLHLGADPDYVGRVISNNFERLLRLRRKRKQSVASFKGVIYGVTGAFAFSVAAAFQVAVYMTHLFSNIQLPGEFIQDILFIPSARGLQLTNYILISILLLHSLLSAFSIKIADGGHLGIALYYFVILTWMSAIGLYLGEFVMGKMMSFSGLILPLMGVGL
ncbi:Flagella-related protein FlaJ [Thermococcus sp. 2319x1]|uniref:archaellar assembly protein FlaJ n=1 Tax=Thermococcus sp. 2319x1 TaxID=1674923 RepID=UPI00073AAADC|nr:archaellar assembly protein FlaJ [Thermococcus sp. 2319x1]ALV62784.1 Flagella-related protein FlaJ [Thermococcus sp. 2319x1]